MTIAITGSTGFLGLRLLPLLMERDCPIVILANAASPPALDRIERQLRAMGEPADGLRDLEVLPIDITRPLLGLAQKEFKALAERLSEIWHCAGSIDIFGPPGRVRPVNVAGTYAILGLASAGAARVVHVSTAFVAGARTAGLIREGDLDGSYGFESAYEHSKFDGEQAVHEWSRRNRRPATIFRPSVLVTDRPAPRGGSAHPLLAASRLWDQVEPLLTPMIAAGERAKVRVAADPEAHINLMPVELGARLMIALAEGVRWKDGVCTAHITYPHEVSVATLVSLFEHRFPIDIQVVAAQPHDSTMLESLVAEQMKGFAPALFHHRIFDRGELRAAGLEPPNALPLDVPYLLSGMEGVARRG
jgi:nucleoside-diphosphate-sugar epimerase